MAEVLVRPTPAEAVEPEDHGVAARPAACAGHHDAARSAVPSTSIGVCCLRALESQKPAHVRLVEDPLAQMLCGGDPREVYGGMFERGGAGMSLDFWVDLMAVRTRWIDDELASLRPQQLVVLGAGLDARAYRLPALTGIPMFEVDLAEVLEAKGQLLRDASPLARLRSVGANLAEHGWTDELERAGFDSSRPSTWLFEGLLGYLTDGELAVLFGNVARLAGPGSSLVATFTAAGSAQCTTMHRKAWDDEADVANFLASHGWKSNDVHDYSALAERMGRAGHLPDDRSQWRYFLSSASLASSCP